MQSIKFPDTIRIIKLHILIDSFNLPSAFHRANGNTLNKVFLQKWVKH